MILSSVMIVIALLIGGLLFYGYKTATATSVSVNFTSRTHVLSKVFSLKADPRVKQPDIAQSIVPGLGLTVTKTAQKSAPTTGEVNCVIFIGCDRGVSPEDEIQLVNQLENTLRPDITAALQDMLSKASGIQVGPINISTRTRTTDPPVNSPGDTVRVTLVQEGSVGYIKQADVKQVVRQKLSGEVAKLGAGFQVVDSTITIGNPTISGVDIQSGQASIKVAAGVIARYQFTEDELQKLSSQLVGKSLSAAQAFLKNQPGIDPESVSIHFLAGDGKTLPDDVQHIKLLPLDPGALPDIHLTPLPTPK